MLQNPELILENRLGREQYFIYRADSKIEPGTKPHGAVLEFQKKNSYRYSIIHDNIAVLFNAQESIYSAGLELMLNPMYKRIADENDNLAKGYNPAKKAVGDDTAQKVYAGLKDRFGENSSKWLALLEKRGLGMDAIAERAMPYIKEEMSFKEMLGLARNILYDNGKGYLSGIKNSLKRAGHYIADEARRLYHDEKGFLRLGRERDAAKGYSPNGYSSGGKKAFTLIELLVVIAIIGILAGFLIPAAMESRKKAKDTKEQVNMQNIATIMQFYNNDWNEFWVRCWDTGSGYGYDVTSLYPYLEVEDKGGIWRDPFRKIKVGDDSVINFAFEDANRDHPPDGYGRILLDFDAKRPSGAFVLNITGWNTIFPKLNLPSDTSYLVVSVGPDGTLEMDPATDVMVIKRKADEKPQRWKGRE